MWTSESLKNFGWQIQKLIDGQDLTREQSYTMFREILQNRQPDLQQGAFLAALTAKGETPLEIAGAWQAIVELDTVPVNEDLGFPLVENSGTGMDRLKTFNVSTAAAVVAAAAGARMARHGARALTSSCGTVDLLEHVGIEVECDVATVTRSIRETGIGLFNGMSPCVHPRALARILSQIRYGSTLNIAASLANPCRPSHALRGVYAKELVPKVSAVMKEIGYQRAMVAHGMDAEGRNGMDELSTLGESVVTEFFADGKEESYTLAPEEVGIKRAAYSEVAATGNVHQEAARFLKVICGVSHPECIDFTCFNAGAILYISGHCKDMVSGVTLSREMIDDGSALKKLVQWIHVQADPALSGRQRLLNVAKSAGLLPELRVCMS